jgi:uncharacterized membrane protein
MSKSLPVWLQGAAAIAFCLVWRLFPWRPPNVEPVLASLMPFGKRYGVIAGFLFGALNMVLFDLITSGWTSWTVVTAVTYGMVGALSAPWLARWQGGIVSFVTVAVVMTIFYDAITGVAAGALLFDMSWKTGFLGQIPFTINHLIGNVILAATLSPFFDWILRQTTPVGPVFRRPARF